ncbi:MAG TPA: glucose-6-phosphate dehydrogenase [Propionibacteriaceae bacterium]|nr:glucose-6-phosphate dehydrogenase [Propionibacteriaceae bacterium]
MPEPARPDQPTVIILYGGTGDLAKRMVLPAFYELFLGDMLPKEFRLVGNGRGDVAHEDFRERVRESLEEFGSDLDLARFDEFAEHVLFAGGGFRRDDPGSLLEVIGEAEREVGEKPALIHYLAVPPDAFEPTTEAIAEHGLAENAKAVYEKPYGTSTDSFRKLDELVHQTFDEEQVYRIDHFLGKEATQNLHLVRFGNRLFGDAWSGEHLAQVQVDVPETLDIADRAEFYDATGAALDMLVTHLFQVAAEVAMEPPSSMAADDLQSAREAVIAAFRPLDPAEVVLGQYSSYRQTEGVAPDSTTDTYVAARLWIDTDRWRGVPFVLRTGKKLAVSAQRVSLIFKPAEGPLHSAGSFPNVLAFDLKGNGAIEIELVVKKPGPEPVPAESATRLNLENVADGSMPPYTSLLYDVLAGNRSLFTSSAGLAEAFRAFQPLLDDPPELETYDDDSWGPAAADRLTDGLGWQLNPDATKGT